MKIDDRYLDPKYGLLNARPNMKTEEENAPLFSVEFLLIHPNAELNLAMHEFIGLCSKGNGLFNQRPINNGSHEDYMSPDQLIAFVAWMNINKDPWRKQVWKYLKRNFFTYDNLTGKFNPRRIIQPLAIAFVGYSVTKSWFWKSILLIACRKACKEFQREIYELELLRSSYSKDTGFHEDLKEQRRKRHNGKDPSINWESSGVLKAFVCLRSVGIYDDFCERFYWEAFKVYFPDEHPVIRMIGFKEVL